MRIGNLNRVAWIALGTFVLAACNTTNKKDEASAVDQLGVGQQTSEVKTDEETDLRAFCPKTVVRAGTETYRIYKNGVTKDDPGALNSLRFQATVTEAVRECNYSGNILNIRVGVRGRAINGPTGESGTFNAPVRIAVVSTAKEVPYSQLHQVPISIPQGGSNARFSFIDSEISIPKPEKNNLVIYVGFDEGPPKGAVTQ